MHEILIKNEGDATPEITDVHPHQPLQRASFDPKIEPGKTGKVTG